MSACRVVLKTLKTLETPNGHLSGIFQNIRGGSGAGAFRVVLKALKTLGTQAVSAARTRLASVLA